MRKSWTALLPLIAILSFIPVMAHANTSDISGNVAVGSSYAGVNTAPTNGMIVQGNVGIGTSSPSYALDVRGTAGSTLASNNAPVINKVNIQKFSSSGTYTPSTGMVYALIEVWGAGGGGGGAGAALNQAAAAGGGSGGAYARGLKTAATISSSQTVTVGAAGSGGSAGVNNGTAGGSSSVGTLISAGGGSYGVGGPASASIGALAGTNGPGSPGGTYDYGVPGQFGLLGIGYPTVSCVSGGGGNSGSGSPGAPGTPNNNTGLSAGGFGGGGAGGCSLNTITTQAGGTGAPGLVIITEYISN